LWLALGTEVRTTVADNYAFNGGAADRTEFTTKAVGNLKLKVGCAQFTTGTEVGIHAGAFIADS